MRMPDTIEQIEIADLAPYAHNARTHSADQVAQIAAAITEWGWTTPVLINADNGIIAGHGRVLAAELLQLTSVPCIRLVGLTADQERALILADNKIALNAGWDDEVLAAELRRLMDAEFDMGPIGFNDRELADILRSVANDRDPDAVPPLPDRPVSIVGDVWQLGAHRVMCGDSTAAADVARLMAGEIAELMHADPPYGMGKEGDGVANDNIYGAKLDQFQMSWWTAFRPFLASNASAYIWGNAPDLWRLWYRGGLGESEKLELRNEIVWDKQSIAGMASPDLTQYPEASERCLFFQFGDQFIGNINADDFPETWEPLRAYLEGEAVSAGIKPGDIKRVCGCGMYGHWFSRSQFTLIPKTHHAKLAAEYPGHFKRSWDDLKADWTKVRGSARDVINEKLGISRSYFDNAHDIMRDVWTFSRVTGEDRHGHATPKPAAMMERVMKSSASPGGICVEPFGGSGSTVIGAEQTGRVCYAMELQAAYVDVMVKRWQEFTGKVATLDDDGRSFNEVSTHRLDIVPA